MKSWMRMKEYLLLEKKQNQAIHFKIKSMWPFFRILNYMYKNVDTKTHVHPSSHDTVPL